MLKQFLTIFRELVRVSRKLPTPPKYERKFYKHSDKKKANKYNKHYLRLSCGTHELVIYDKTYQLRDGNLIVGYQGLPEGVLRFEVRCEREYIRKVEKGAGDLNTLELLWLMITESEDRIIDHFSRCFPDMTFVQSVDKALQKMEKQGYDTVGLLDKFTKLGVSPIPLRKNFCAESLPGPVELLKRISDGDIAVEYVKAKYK